MCLTLQIENIHAAGGVKTAVSTECLETMTVVMTTMTAIAVTTVEIEMTTVEAVTITIAAGVERRCSRTARQSTTSTLVVSM
jgi:hypothetical protein